MKELEKMVGEKDAKNFKKKSKQYGKIISLHGLINRVARKGSEQLHDNLADCLKATVDEARHTPKLLVKILGNDKMLGDKFASVAKTVGGEAAKAAVVTGRDKIAQQAAKAGEFVDKKAGLGKVNKDAGEFSGAGKVVDKAKGIYGKVKSKMTKNK